MRRIFHISYRIWQRLLLRSRPRKLFLCDKSFFNSVSRKPTIHALFYRSLILGFPFIICDLYFGFLKCCILHFSSGRPRCIFLKLVAETPALTLSPPVSQVSVELFHKLLSAQLTKVYRGSINNFAVCRAHSPAYAARQVYPQANHLYPQP